MKDSGVWLLLILVLLLAQQGTQGGRGRQQKTGDKGRQKDCGDGVPDFRNDDFPNGVPDGADGFQRFHYNSFDPEKSYEKRNDFGLMN